MCMYILCIYKIHVYLFGWGGVGLGFIIQDKGPKWAYKYCWYLGSSAKVKMQAIPDLITQSWENESSSFSQQKYYLQKVSTLCKNKEKLIKDKV